MSSAARGRHLRTAALVSARARRRRDLGAIEFAQPVERGAAYARLGALQPASDEISLAFLVEPVGDVEQPVHERIAVARLESSRRTQKIIEAPWFRSQRAACRPAAQRRLKRRPVVGERVLDDRVRTAGAAAQLDLQPSGETQVNG